MTTEEYMEKLQMKYERHFDVSKDELLLGEKIDIFAKFYNISGRTFITQKDIIDRCENHEYCFIKKFDTFAEKEAVNFGLFLKKAVNSFVNPGGEHMSTYITGVIVANSVDCSGKRVVLDYHCSRAFMFYLHGWCDVRYICVDLENKEVITNKAGKRVKKVYQVSP